MMAHYPRKVYVIFPFNSDGTIAGVYVGSSYRVKERIECHKGDHQSKHMVELHDLMRENGFKYQIIDEIGDWRETHIEYDWIDFFKKKTTMKVFNFRQNICGADWHRLKEVTA